MDKGTNRYLNKLFNEAKAKVADYYLRHSSGAREVETTLKRFFREPDTRNAWLLAPNLLLRGKSPLDVMYLDYKGSERVLDIIEAQL